MGRSAFDFDELIVSADMEGVVDRLRLCGWSNREILAHLALQNPGPVLMGLFDTPLHH